MSWQDDPQGKLRETKERFENATDSPIISAKTKDVILAELEELVRSLRIT